MSFDYKEDKYFFPNPPNLASFLSGNSEDEKLCFSSTPSCDSSDREDVDVHIEFSNHGCRGLFINSFDHDVDSLTVNISKLLVFEDIYSYKVETPQAIEALQPKLMVMSAPRGPKVSYISNKKSIESPQAPHRSLVHIENQLDPHILHPPPESHDPIAQALKESYISSHVEKGKFSSFYMFSHFSRSKKCTCFSFAHNVMLHHGTSIECILCTFTIFFFFCIQNSSMLVFIVLSFLLAGLPKHISC